MTNALTIDVEDYFHPNEVQPYVDAADWDRLPSRVTDSTRRVLALLAPRGVKATFFVLGWVARRHPGLVREIAAAGHEIGCHSDTHRLVYDLTPGEFRRDTQTACAAIADASGHAPRLYRAPSFSITERSLWALEVLAECGFTHDSSIYPVRHDRYGIAGFGVAPRIMSTSSGPILEVPPAATCLSASRVVPVGGGGYLRLLPYRFTAAGLRQINNSERRPACFYIHPWEIDPGQPRLARGFVARARTYSGLAQMAGKLERLLADFRFSTMGEVFPAA